MRAFCASFFDRARGCVCEWCACFLLTLTQTTKAIWFRWIYLKPLKATYTVYFQFIRRRCHVVVVSFYSFAAAAQALRSILCSLNWLGVFVWACFYSLFVSLIAGLSFYRMPFFFVIVFAIRFPLISHLHCRCHWFLIRKKNVADLLIKNVKKTPTMKKLCQSSSVT